MPSPRRITTAAAMLALAGCTAGTPATPLPDPPAPLVQPAEYGFGGAIQATDYQAGREAEAKMAAALGDAAGEPVSTHWIAPAAFDPVALGPYYAARARPAGWVPVDGFGRGARTVGWSGLAWRAGSRGFALLWLERPAPNGRRLFTMLRYGPHR